MEKIEFFVQAYLTKVCFIRLNKGLANDRMLLNN